MNYAYNQWGGLVGDQNMIPQQKKLWKLWTI